MLNAMREGAKSGFMKFILLGFMFFAVAGLVLMDIGGFFRGGSGQTYVAKVAGEQMPLGPFDQQARRVIRQQNLDMSTAYRMGMVDWVLRSEINKILMNRFAYDMGILIGKETIAKNLADLVEPFVTEGVTPQQALNRVLRAQNMSEGALVASIKSEMTTALIQNTFEIGTGFSSTPESEAMYRYDNEERKIKGLLIETDKVTDYGEVTDESLEALYKKQQAQYAVPEARSFTIAVIDESVVAESTEIPEEDLKAAYEAHKDSFTLPARRQLEQAIFLTEEVANDVKKTLGEKTNLEEAVKKITDSDDSYTGSETYELDGLPEEFAQEVFDAKEGDVLGPIQSAFGWHLIIVQEVMPEELQAFEDVKDGIEKELRQEFLDEELLAIANLIDDNLAGGMTLPDAIKEAQVKIEPQSFSSVTLSGKNIVTDEEIELFGDDKSYLLETIYSLQNGEISPVTQLSDGSYAVIRLDEIEEKHHKALEDVKEELTELWVKTRKTQKAFLQAQAAWEKLSVENAKFSDVAKEHKAKIKDYSLKRQDKAPEDIGTKAQNSIFMGKKGEYVLTPVPAGFMLALVDDIVLPKAASSDDTFGVSSKIARANQQEYFNLFTAALYEKYKVDINRSLLDQYYGQDSETY